jgi:hypothetical protein
VLPLSLLAQDAIPRLSLRFAHVALLDLPARLLASAPARFDGRLSPSDRRLQGWQLPFQVRKHRLELFGYSLSDQAPEFLFRIPVPVAALDGVS